MSVRQKAQDAADSNRSGAALVEQLRGAQSIAVVGASQDRTRPGGRVIAALLRHGFAGAIYPVNPGRTEVQGLASFPAVTAAPGPVHVAFIVVSADRVQVAVQDCVAAGVAVIIVGSAGFSETGTAGRTAQDELVRIARAGGCRLIGPNTNGVAALANGLLATFTPAVQQFDQVLTDGPVAIVSQSGALGAAAFALAQADGVRVGLMVNTGNEADVSFEEVLGGAVAADPDLAAVLGYVEGFTHPHLLIAAARTAHRHRTTLAVLKVGTTPRGAAAAAAHTSKLSGEDRVVDGVLRQLGIVRAETLSELLNIARMAGARPRLSGNRLTVASLSGGLGIIVADAAERFGLELAEWSETWQQRFDGLTPDYLGRSNPIDLGGSPFWDMQLLADVVTLLDSHADSDLVLLALANFEGQQDAIASALLEAHRRASTPLAVVWFGDASRARARLNDAGIPAFAEPVDAVRAAAAVLRRGSSSLVVEPARGDGGAKLPAVQALLDRSSTAILDSATAADILSIYELPVVRQLTLSLAADLSPGADLTREIDFPCPAFLKLESASLPHKSDAGGVLLVERPDEMAASVAQLRDIAEQMHLKDAQLLVQQRVKAGSELLLGMVQDPVFGPVVTLGVGGVLAEALDDVVVRLPHLDSADVQGMLADLRHQVMLRGFRHLPSVDVPAVLEVVARFADLVHDCGHLFEAIDLNPLIVGVDGTVQIVDMLLVKQ